MILLLEINEFNYDLLHQMADEHNLIHIKKLLQLKTFEFTIQDNYESDFLEPWSQWVSLHTGTPTSLHQIKHLGDVPKLNQPSLWEKMAEQGLKVGVWGVMNGMKGRSENIKFFMPDPWTFDEHGHPKEIQNLLTLPRYIAKNYLNISVIQCLKKLPRFIKGLSCVPFRISLINEFFKTFIKSLQYKGAHFVWINFFDYLTAHSFLHLKKKYKTDFNIFFMNSVAHAQHHYWDQKTWDRLSETYRNLDQILKLFWLDNKKTDLVYVTNGLSQRPRHVNEKPWILYRQKDPVTFFKSFQLETLQSEQLMTHDSHLFFPTEEKMQKAFQILSETTLLNQKLFLCEKDPIDPKRFFVRLNFFDPVDLNSEFILNGKKYLFFDYFKQIVTRTGYHIPKAHLLTNRQDPPQSLQQPEIFNYISGSKTKDLSS